MPVVKVGGMGMHVGQRLVRMGMSVADVCRLSRVLVVAVVMPMTMRVDRVLVSVNVPMLSR